MLRSFLNQMKTMYAIQKSSLPLHNSLQEILQEAQTPESEIKKAIFKRTEKHYLRY